MNPQENGEVAGALRLPLYQCHKKVRALKIKDVVSRTQLKQKLSIGGEPPAEHECEIILRLSEQTDELKTFKARSTSGCSTVSLKEGEQSPEFTLGVEDFMIEASQCWQASLEFEDGQVKVVTAEYIAKHQPQVGGYYVVYEDGYESYSPAKAFEEGYSLCVEPNPLNFGNTVVLGFAEVSEVVQAKEGRCVVRMKDTNGLLDLVSDTKEVLNIETGDFIQFEYGVPTGYVKKERMENAAPNKTQE